jgi:inosine/xanthosine triphosphatase
MSGSHSTWRHGGRIAVGSSNPAKINAVASAFSTMFADTAWLIQGYSTDSGVAAQPMTSAETFQGAQHRLQQLFRQLQHTADAADFYVAIEAGLDHDMTFAWICIGQADVQAPQPQLKQGKARSASLMLPPAVIQQLQQGQELGDVMDRCFGTHNIKQAGGAIGLLTHNHLSRSLVYEQAIILAAIPFLQPTWFSDHDNSHID